MVDTKRVKPSDNFEDRTDDTPAQKLLTNIAAALNPVSAVRKTYHEIQGKLIEKGIITVPGADEYLRKIDEAIRKRHAEEQKHPQKGFTVNDQGILVPMDGM